MEDLFNANSALTSSETNFIDQGKDTTDIDELMISQDCPTLILFAPVIIMPMMFIPSFFIPNKRVVILDSVKKKIIFCDKNIYGCNCGMKKKYMIIVK